jgi:ABC-2 type transport system permease protein
MISHVFSKQNKALLSELVRTDFKLRYQGSVLGYAWSLLRPLLLFVILYIVFVKFLRIGGDVPNYPIYLLLGIVLWGFFADMTSQSLGSIVARGDLIRKIRIPRWMIVFSSSISALINLGFNMIVIGLFMAINGIELSKYAVLFPLILLEIYILALGVSLYLSAAFVKYRDISYIWEVFLQAGFYATPILYPLSVIPDVAYQKILIVNPMAQALQDARSLVVTSQTTTITDLYGSMYARLATLGIVVAIFIIGFFYFKNQSTSFAENL